VSGGTMGYRQRVSPLPRLCLISSRLIPGLTPRAHFIPPLRGWSEAMRALIPSTSGYFK
jgi:hypothetical protein